MNNKKSRSIAKSDWRALLSPSMFWRPRFLDPSQPYWIGHIPFAFWIVEALKPKVLVELGTHTANSYFAFCQAVEGLGLNTKCYAVDTWKGDDHTGSYGEEIFATVDNYNATHYAAFSTLVRSTFDQARAHFTDGSVDLLHIDGCHTFEAVKHDFETWLPKMSAQGVVLLHDTNVRRDQFGVSRLFERLRGEYPAFEFYQSHGLGVVGVGASLNSAVIRLCNASSDTGAQENLHRIFSTLGQACLDRVDKERGEADLAAARLRVQDLSRDVDESATQRALLSGELEKLGKGLEHYKQHTAALERTVAEGKERSEALGEDLAREKQRGAALENLVSRRDEQVATAYSQVNDLANTVRAMRGSTSWKLTAPLRWVKISTRRSLGKTILLPRHLRLRLAHSRLARNRFVWLGRQTLNRANAFLSKLPTSLRLLLTHRRSGLFDHAWYVQNNPDVRQRSRRPFVHFALHGVFEGRTPHAGFDPDYYLERNPDVGAYHGSPLMHYVLWGFRENRPWRKAFADTPDCELREHPLTIPRDGSASGPTIGTDIRAIAMYLPQFHAIPENDEWWGPGFTEWTNVRRAVPQYEGHYQPHVPHSDLGHYDLSDPSILEKQAAMARAAGIEGFCFYYYWFNGKRLLEMPTDRLLETGQPDFPFCFCWANEDWTRTWDGAGHEILIGQSHSPESDERFIHDLLPAFRDKRYIRVDGKPLLIVYRPGLLPEPLQTSQRWREICCREGIGEIFLAFMRGFEAPEPSSIGFDAGIHFPPLQGGAPVINDALKLHDPAGFQGLVRDYRELQRIFDPAKTDDKLWPCVCPSWDNTARRMERAHSWAHATPENYYRWLSSIVSHLRATQPAERRLVFINAWNEWAEGCHLEPDLEHGYAWLNATRAALRDVTPNKSQLRLLAIGHDAFRAGAQVVLLQLLRELKRTGRVEIRLVLRGGGALYESYADDFETVLLPDDGEAGARMFQMKDLLAWKPDLILSNTVTNGMILAELAALTDDLPPVVTHVHELQKSIERWSSGAIMAATLRHSDHFLAVSEPVRANLLSTHAVPEDRISVVHAFIQCRAAGYPDQNFRLSKRKKLGLSSEDFVVAGCGTTDWRKGPDLFVETAKQVIKHCPAARFVWVGKYSDKFKCWATAARKSSLGNKIRFVGERTDARECLAAADVFFLSSREDPFPLVALEAADAAVPIVAFAESGGMPGFIGDEAGVVVPSGDTTAAAEAILALQGDATRRRKLGDQARAKVQRLHSSERASAEILEILRNVCTKNRSRISRAAEANPPRHTNTRAFLGRSKVRSKPLITVIVPNYNHAPFLNERLESIVNQGVDDLEILLMDDCSQDASPGILEDFCRHDSRARLLINTTNSGSTFRQWKKGLAEARGEFVWIAESDDAADPGLLKSLLELHERNSGTIFCYAQSLMMDLSSRPHGPATTWTDDIDAERWNRNYVAPGLEELAVALSVKNTIPNVSAVLFRNRPALREVVDENMRLCADWLSYVRLCSHGEIGYCHRPLNRWRLASSNARTKPPGETEWLEGARIYEEIGRLLGWTDEELQQRREEFRRKCEAWKEAA